jgi:hypothetical protein
MQFLKEMQKQVEADGGRRIGGVNRMQAFTKPLT